MELAGCEPLRDLLSGRRVVVLAATEGEAEPLLAALLREASHTLAGKKIYLGMTKAEAGDIPVVVGVTGCDKANTAHLLTCLLQAMNPAPALVMQMGIGGAFATGGPLAAGSPDGRARVGDVVIATSEAYADTGSTSPGGWLSAAELRLPIAWPGGPELGGVFPLDARLAEAAREAVIAAGVADAGVGDAGVAGAGTDGPATRGLPAVLLGPCVTSSCATGVLSDALTVARRWGALAESMEGAAAAHICTLYDVPFLEIRGISNLITDRDRQSWEIGRAVAVAAQATLAVVGAVGRLPLPGGAS